MRARRWWVAGLGTLVLASGCQSSEHGGGLDLERMVDQRRFGAYDATDLFPDGSAMRVPPEGTVPFGDEPAPVVRTGRRDGTPVDRIPLPLTAELLAAGRRRFDITCAPCHGFTGNASTPVAAAMEIRPPPSLHEERIRGLSDGRLFGIVSDGYGLMPGYGAYLEPEERWAVIAYVRALQLSRRLPLDTLPPAVRDSVRARLERATGGTP